MIAVPAARPLAGTACAFAALAYAVATEMTLAKHDAFGMILVADLLAILAFLTSAFVARSPLGTAAAILAVPFFLFDVFLRALGSALATDSPRPISALTFYEGDGSNAYPLLGFLLILTMSFALRKQARLAWPCGLLDGAAAVIVFLSGHDSSMLEGLWLLATAVALLRPRQPAIVVLIVALGLAATSRAYADVRSDAWVGHWTAQTGENQQSLDIVPRGGELHVTGLAVWYDRASAARNLIPVGYFATIIAQPLAGRVTLAPGDMPGCVLQVRLNGATLIARDNQRCGGMNVTFTGAYHRRQTSLRR